jgi:hypothetical protein
MSNLSPFNAKHTVPTIEEYSGGSDALARATNALVDDFRRLTQNVTRDE